MALEILRRYFGPIEHVGVAIWDFSRIPHSAIGAFEKMAEPMATAAGEMIYDALQQPMGMSMERTTEMYTWLQTYGAIDELVTQPFNPLRIKES